MKTTLNLDDELLLRAKRRAASEGTTLTAVVEDALRSRLSSRRDRTDFSLVLPTVRGEHPPAADPADRDAMYDLMEATPRRRK